MPELHKLTPLLGALQDQGYRVALLTDGRMSGASGKVLAAIHLSPDSAQQGPICRIREGDLIEIDCAAGTLEACVDEQEWSRRDPWQAQTQAGLSHGRGLFGLFRSHAGDTEHGASALIA